MAIYEAPTGRTYRDWQAVFDEAQPLQLTGFNTGHIRGALKNNAQPDSFPPHRDPAEAYDYPVMVFRFRHPTKGDILIDTGFDRSFHDRPGVGNLSIAMRAYATLMRVRYTQSPDDIDLTSQLEKHGIDPSHVFLTHLHADHTGGLPALPSQLPIFVGRRERSLLSRLLVGTHLRGKSSLHLIDVAAGTEMAPFSHVLDVFGDGTFWALSTPGHTPDHLSYLVNSRPAPVLIVGDAELTSWAMEEEILVSALGGARANEEVQRSATMIRTFHEMFPQAHIWFSHDEEHLEAQHSNR